MCCNTITIDKQAGVHPLYCSYLVCGYHRCSRGGGEGGQRSTCPSTILAKFEFDKDVFNFSCACTRRATC